MERLRMVLWFLAMDIASIVRRAGVGGQYGCSAGDVARNRAMFSGPGQHEVPGISIPA
jgi:hypothetical protein